MVHAGPAARAPSRAMFAAAETKPRRAVSPLVFIMKGLLIVLGLAVVGASAFDPAVRVKFNVGFRPGTDFFFDIPRNVTRAVLDRWTLTDRPVGPRAPLVLYCPPDRIVCGFYDDNGIIAGLQVAVPQDDFTESVYNWQAQGFTEWVPTTPTGEIIRYWAIQQYFVNEEYLQLNAADRLAHYDRTKLLQQDALWLTGFYGVVDEVSATTSGIENSIFTRQACIPWMGRHFYYNMTRNTPCRADTLYPWFPIVHSGQLVATGLIMYGQLSVPSNQRDWFERPPRLAVQLIVPDGPECLYDLASNPGLVTMHIYYIDTPWSLGCLLN